MTFDAPAARARIDGAARTISSLAADAELLVRVAQTVNERLRAGGTVLTCGNGGSAAEALHLAEELIGRYRAARRPWPAVCLNADPTALTCIANDYGYDEVFARQAEALAGPQDVLVAFSTSGASPNIVRALAAAKKKGAVTIGLLGRNGGEARPLCDHAVIVRSDDTAHIQEAHQVILHIILEAVEAP